MRDSGQWAYCSGNDRKGPFSAKEIRGLIKNGVITSETRLGDYGSARDYPAIKTEFSVDFQRGNFFTATMNAQVSDIWIWLVVFFPLLFTAGPYYVYYIGWDSKFYGFPLIIAGLNFDALFMFIDCILMQRKGYKPPVKKLIYSLFYLPMVYLYYRNKQLMKKQTSALMSAAGLILIIYTVFSWPLLNNKDIEQLSVGWFNSILQWLSPEITAECVSASVQKRRPGMVFEVTGYLSSNQEMKLILAQSWNRLTLYEEEANIVMPKNIGEAFNKKLEEKANADITPDANPQ